MSLKIIIKTLLIIFFFQINLFAIERLPEEFKIAKIEEKISQKIDLDTFFYNSTGEKVYIKDLVKDKPVILNFVYYSCPRLCHFLVDGLVDGVNKLNASFLNKFDIISVSFDTRDTIETTTSFQERYTNKLTNKQVQWSFLSGDEENINKLTSSAGFNFFFNDNIEEYAHAATLIIINQDGEISRYLHGITFFPFDLRLAIIEATDKKYVSSLDSVLMYCYNYDPDERGYVLEAMVLMKVVCSLSLLFFLIFLYNLYRQKK